MREPDLRRHLQNQTSLAIGHIPHTELHTRTNASHALQREIDVGAQAILFDTIDTRSLEIATDVLWQSALEQQLFCAASSGLTAGLISSWRKQGLLGATPSPSILRSASPLLVISGSCSLATSRQIDWAARNGFRTVHADPAETLDRLRGTAYQARLIRELTAILNRGEDAVLYTCFSGSASAFAGESLGTALGLMLRELLSATAISRVVLCGGDTSSHAVQQLGISALTWKASLQPGAPLCQVHFAGDQSQSLELVLKGGQVGSDNFFAIAKGAQRDRGPSSSAANHASRNP